MNHKSRVKRRADFKIKKEETQAVPRCHTKSSKKKVRNRSLQLTSSHTELTVSPISDCVVSIWKRQCCGSNRSCFRGRVQILLLSRLVIVKISSSLGLSFLICKQAQLCPRTDMSSILGKGTQHFTPHITAFLSFQFTLPPPSLFWPLLSLVIKLQKTPRPHSAAVKKGGY